MRAGEFRFITMSSFAVPSNYIIDTILIWLRLRLLVANKELEIRVDLQTDLLEPKACSVARRRDEGPDFSC